MIIRTAFELDCNPIIPKCRFTCAKCIQEIETTLTSKEGVSKVYIEGEAEKAKLIVEHDPAITNIEQLIEDLKKLPSFYDGFFIPTVVTS
jgi:copper chaperone CopZ